MSEGFFIQFYFHALSRCIGSVLPQKNEKRVDLRQTEKDNVIHAKRRYFVKKALLFAKHFCKINIMR